MSAESTLLRIWYGGATPLAWLLAPLSLLFRSVVALRRWLYRHRWLAVGAAGVPVVVVGNVTVGGTGKTPFVAWLARELVAAGMRPGIVLRGYGGAGTSRVRRVTADDDPRQVGDEAVLLAASTPAIVVAAHDRLAAARHARQLGADIVLSDDGLQHYRLDRDAEFVVLDAARLVGNGWVLPAGPLREPVARLRQVTLLLVNQRDGARDAYEPGLENLCARTRVSRERVVWIALRPTIARSLVSGERRTLESFRGRKVHALAGIGHPEGFFAALTARGIEVERHAPGDHAQFTAQDLEFGDTAPVLMTAKDAVKCRTFANERCWVVDAEIVVDAAGAARVLGAVTAALRS